MATVANTASTPASASPFVTHARLVEVLSLREFCAAAPDATLMAHNTAVAARTARKSEHSLTEAWGGARNEIRFSRTFELRPEIE